MGTGPPRPHAVLLTVQCSTRNLAISNSPPPDATEAGPTHLHDPLLHAQCPQCRVDSDSSTKWDFFSSWANPATDNGLTCRMHMGHLAQYYCGIHGTVLLWDTRHSRYMGTWYIMSIGYLAQYEYGIVGTVLLWGTWHSIIVGHLAQYYYGTLGTVGIWALGTL